MISEEAPTERIFNTILFYALKDGADAFSLEPTSKGTAVRSLIHGEWQEKMKIPSYVHIPLLKCVRGMVKRDDSRSNLEHAIIEIRLKDEKLPFKLSFDLAVEFEATQHGEKSTFRFQPIQGEPTG